MSSDRPAGTPPDDRPDDQDAAAAAAALRRAVAAGGSGEPAGGTRRTGQTSSRRTGSGTAYGPGRDPSSLKDSVEKLIGDRGWQDSSAASGLLAKWTTIAGTELADHVRPTSFDSGELVIQADSTAWATQLRLLLPVLHASIDQAIGTGVVTRIRILGPAAPDWSAGPRRVKGRGPRDTYG